MLLDGDGGELTQRVVTLAGTTSDIRYTTPPGTKRFFLKVTIECCNYDSTVPYQLVINPAPAIVSGPGNPPLIATASRTRPPRKRRGR